LNLGEDANRQAFILRKPVSSFFLLASCLETKKPPRHSCARRLLV